MLKFLPLALIILAFAAPARAQFTTVTATIADPNGIPYAGATMSAILVPGSSGGFTLSGKPYSGQIGPVALDSTGKFSQNFGDVTLITPSGAQWLITIDSAGASIALPLGTGPQSFTYTSTGTTISGGSLVNLTTALNALAPKLTNFAGAGTGTVTGSGASPQVAVWSGPNSVSGSAALTQGDGTNAAGIFNGPAISTLSANLRSLAIAGLLPEIRNTRLLNSATTDNTFMNIQSLGETDADVSAYTGYFAIDATNAKTSAVVGIESDDYINVPSSFTNGNVQTGFESALTFYGAGTQSGAAPFQSLVTNSGTGTVTNAQGFNAPANANTGSGTIVNSFGYTAYDMAGVGTTLNAAFYAYPQTVGAHNWGYYSDKSNKDHFGNIYLTSLLISSTAPTIATNGCGGTNSTISAANGTGSFEILIGSGGATAAGCTITMPAAATNWTCDANTIGSTTTSYFLTKQTGPVSTTSVILQEFNDVAAAVAFATSDTIRVKCSSN